MTRRPICLVCLILMLCMCAADLAGVPLIRGNPLPDDVQAYIRRHPSAEIIGEVQRCQATEFSFSVYLKNVSLIVRSKEISIQNVRVFLKNEEKLPPGTLVSVKGRLEAISGPGNPGEFDSRQYYACQHIYYFLKKGQVLKKSRQYSGYYQKLLELREQMEQALRQCAGEDAPVFEAMLLGEKSALDQELKLRYQMAGIAHVLAISGLHISILGMGLFALLKKLSLGNGAAGLIALLVMLQYGIFTGGSVSAMRAVCMFVLAMGARILGRIYDLLTAVALSAILLLLDSPAYLYSSSFLLSFGAVVGIGAVAPCLMEITGIKSKAGRALVSSLAVQAATLPVMLAFFCEVSVAGILLNLAVLPTVGGVLASGLCCSILGLISPGLGMLGAFPGRMLLWIYEKLCVLAGRIPFCSWVGGLPGVWQGALYYGLLALGLTVGMLLVGRKKEDREKKGRRVLPTAVCLAAVSLGILIVAWKPKGKFSITCLDIGQGDCIVLKVPENGVFLVDCGSSNKKNIAGYQLLPYLKSCGITYVDGIFVSHTDNDHISGLMEFFDYMIKGLTPLKAGTLFLPQWNSPPEELLKLANLAEQAGLKVKTLKAGDGLSCGEVEFQVLAPDEYASGEDVNEEGMVMEVRYGDFSGLFTGDIGADTEKKLLDKFEDVDFLKTAHHGSRYSTCQEFLDRTKPELAVISCSDSNTYGHPSPETTLRMKKSGVRTEYTMKNGAITVETDGKDIWLRRFVEESSRRETEGYSAA